ncbi:G-type lectin S-receptor-like serine/threonine-protein kinase LECRK3 [Humulus lupulus]|uniref:G-type lectin S-receptor-like serine/threonine-protein kinase LECRK3 n=1 Tax=Humulus lupulus TaxID=3486 RepID=UPI002B417525|nr:G-type lectin S-receptor-like serine/threonine-protein kinase LECRK3 [Humulus lupulus]
MFPGSELRGVIRVDTQELQASSALKTHFSRLVLGFPEPGWVAEWISTENKCDPVGLCGLNSYCILNNSSKETDCSCLPGFDFIDPNQKNLGCQRNSSIDSCASDHEKVFRVAEFDELEWENNSYSVVSYMNKTDCQEDYLRDCNCMVALFGKQQCSKQMVPLRFAKPETEGLITTIVKVPYGGDYGSHSNMPPKKGHRKNTIVFVLACIIVVLTILLFSLLRELEIATSGFIHKLGRGSFGTVFKGTINLPNGERAIAVKRLEKVAGEGEVEFQNEMRSIGRTHHRNLLRLLGYCHEGSNRLLLYEYMTNGSLANFLFKSEVKPKWNERVNMAFGIAKGLLYLHEECENQIIHCDINPNNILIDEKRTVKIVDFGLAKLLRPDQTRTTIGIKGTRGFVAPEWQKNMAITSKVDVYSFGVVLLVIISCRPHVDLSVHEREAILVEFTYDCVRANEVRNLVQLQDDEDVDEEELLRMVKIGLWCIEEEPNIRPAMKKVVAMFEGTVDIPLPPGVASYNGTSYHSASYNNGVHVI